MRNITYTSRNIAKGTRNGDGKGSSNTPNGSEDPTDAYRDSANYPWRMYGLRMSESSKSDCRTLVG